MAVTISGNGVISGARPPKVVNVTSSGFYPFALTNGSYSAFGLSASIAPSFAESKILVTATIPTWMGVTDSSTECQLDLRLLRDGTQIYEHASAMSVWLSAVTTGQRRFRMNVPFEYLDSPSTTSSVTYSIEAKANYASGSVQVNNAVEAKITLMEVTA